MKTETKVRTQCPECDCRLFHSNGVGQLPEHLYCPVCMDVAYDPVTGEIIGRLE